MRNKVDKENNLENNNQGEESTKEIKIFCKTIHGIYIKKERSIQYSYFYLLMKWLFWNIIIIL